MAEKKTKTWSIEKGDYKRDDQSTWSYQRKQIRKRNLKYFLLTVLYLAAITIAALLILT